MNFHSILFKSAEDRMRSEVSVEPEYFRDLNLDQIVRMITSAKQEYHLEPFFYTYVRDIDTIKYRQEIMIELENDCLFEIINTFAQNMNKMRESLTLSDKFNYVYQKQRWFLNTVEIYCNTINIFTRDLSAIELKSEGMLNFCEYLRSYFESINFKTLLNDTQEILRELSTVKYCMMITYCKVNVRKYQSETDYSAEIERVFEKFKQGTVENPPNTFSSISEMNIIEQEILGLVAKLYPDVFIKLKKFHENHADYLDIVIKEFNREIQFYISYLEFAGKFKQEGLKFCYPHISNSKEVYNYNGFDLALAISRYQTKNSTLPIVCNDFYLKERERVIIVSGPNQGGKTTFARAFGQMHFLAGLGCPVPGTKARLFLFDKIFTHFEKAENLKNFRGQLKDDLIRIHEIMNQATTNSIIIINEIFSSTALTDAISLGKKVMKEIIRLDVLCVCVTFLYELSTLGEETVSMVSIVAPDKMSIRNFKIMRKNPDGLSYAKTIAEKYNLTYNEIKERIQS